MDAYQLVFEGREMSPDAAAALERELESDAANLETRARLLGFYGKGAPTSAAARKRFREFNLWFIENAPESEVCAIPVLDLPPKANRAFYKRARSLWLEHCRQRSASLPVLEHAARFFTLLDPKVAERLLLRCESLEPKMAKWKDRLGRLFEKASEHGPRSRRRAAARAALRKYEQSLRLTSDRNFRFYQLPALARVAFSAGDLRKATKYGRAAISEAELFKDWAHGNGIHHGHCVLGRVAFARGDKTLAAKHLLDAGRTPGSPQLNSYGPNFALAEELLNSGDKASVLEFLELCRRFWSYRAKALDAWQQQIRAGKRPDFKSDWKFA